MKNETVPAREESRRQIAILAEDGTLIGRIAAPASVEWDAYPIQCRFENGFDNALGRYRLIEHEPGRWRFEPINHARDAAKENEAVFAQIAGPLARIVWGLARDRVAIRAEDVDALAEFINSSDGM